LNVHAPSPRVITRKSRARRRSVLPRASSRRGTPQILPDQSDYGPAAAVSQGAGPLLIAFIDRETRQLTFRRRVGAEWQPKVTAGDPQTT
jgi:hypothetical protein